MKHILFRLVVAAAVAFALALRLVPSIEAYSTYAKWATLRVSFYVNPSNRDVSQNAAISALQAGMDVWNTQAGTPFRFSYAGQVGDTTHTFDQRNVALFRNSSNGGAIASTYTWRSNGYIVDADVVFWDGAFKMFTGSAGCSSGVYIEDIAAHEFGHALGMSHSNVSGATMYPGYSGCSMNQRTLSSDDIAGAKSLYGSSSVPDTAPVVTILAPQNGATAAPGTAVTFTGSATDAADGDLSSDLVWRSNIDGQIGTGATFTKALAAGSHTITATVSDSKGHTASASRLLTVASGNTGPTVTIATPMNGASVPAGTSMTFSGSASDTQDGNISSKLVWRSSIDGQIGTGASFTRTLTAGTHAITATATDSGGLTGQKSVTVSATTSNSTAKLTATADTAGDGSYRTQLVWSGLTSTKVYVFRNNVKIASRDNDGQDRDPISSKGTYTYKVCAEGTSTCTNQATVTF